MKEERPADSCKTCRLTIETLTKEKRKVEAEFMKQAAVLSQKIELMHMQLKDAEERETSFKKMHDTMMEALKQDGAESQLIKEREFMNSINEKEKEELRKHFLQSREQWEKQLQEQVDKN